jgi:hypothetical protein
MNKIYTDFEVTQLVIGGMPLKDMSSLTFLGWVAGKINNQETNSPTLSELGMMVVHPPFGKMSIENKLEVIRKLEKLNIEIV